MGSFSRLLLMSKRAVVIDSPEESCYGKVAENALIERERLRASDKFFLAPAEIFFSLFSLFLLASKRDFFHFLPHSFFRASFRTTCLSFLS